MPITSSGHISEKKDIWESAQIGDLNEIIYQTENGFDLKKREPSPEGKTIFEIASENGQIKVLGYLTAYLTAKERNFAKQLRGEKGMETEEDIFVEIFREMKT